MVVVNVEGSVLLSDADDTGGWARVGARAISRHLRSPNSEYLDVIQCAGIPSQTKALAQPYFYLESVWSHSFALDGSKVQFSSFQFNADIMKYRILEQFSMVVGTSPISAVLLRMPCAFLWVF